MSSHDPTRPPVAARRLGYVIGIGVNAVLFYLANVWPGWSAVPFLTDATPRVLGLVNAVLVVGVAADLAYIAYDPRWFTVLGELVTMSVGLAGLVLIWQVFPFAFTSAVLPGAFLAAGFDWALVTRIVLAVGIVGTMVALVADAVRLLLLGLTGATPHRHGHAGR